MATQVKYVTVPSKTLAASINASAYLIQLSDIVGWDGNNLASSNFGDVLWAVLRDSSNTFMEIIQLDPMTIANPSVTVLKRGLDFSGGTVEITANKLTWIKNDTIVELGSNPPQLLGQAVALTGNQTILDLKTFATLPQSTAIPTVSADFATKSYVDGVVGGNANYDQNIVNATAGENLTAGNVSYLKASDGKWYIADSATASKSVAVQLGIVQATVLSGAAARVLVAGRDKTQTGLTAGSVYYLSTTGSLSTTPGANIRLIGQVPNGSTTDLICDMLPAADPNVSLTDGSRNYATDTGTANTYVITAVPAFSALKAGQQFSFLAANSNTTVSTLNVSGLGAKTIKKLGSTDLASGDITAGQIVQVEYDGTNMQLVSPVANAPLTATGDASQLTVGTTVPVVRSSVAGESITIGQPVCFLPFPAVDLTYDNSAKGSGTAATITSSPFTVGNNTNRMLTVVAHVTGSNFTVSGITYNGVGMTQLATAGTSSSGRRFYVFYLLAPTVGSANVVISTSSASANVFYYIYSHYNVAQNAPEKSSLTEETGTATLTYSPVNNGALVVGFCLGNQGALPTGVPTNHAFTDNTNDKIGDTGVNYPPVNTSITGTTAGSGGYCIGWYSIAPLVAGGSSRAYLTRSTIAPTSNGYGGIARATATIGQTLKIAVAGIDNNQTGLLPGTQYYLNDTAGTFGTSAGTVTRKAGIAVSPTEMLITNIW